MSINEKMTAIADAIRGKTGDTEPLGLDDMATEIPKVYEAGQRANEEAFWDDITVSGKRANFTYAFAQWDIEYIRPNRKIVPTANGGVVNTFNGCANLKKVEREYFDFSQVPKGTLNNNGYYFTWYNCPELIEIEDIGIGTIPSFYYYTTFGNCGKLKTIGKIGVDEDSQFNTNVFAYCSSLEHLEIVGTIGKNNFTVQWSPNLTHDSLMSIINALKDYSADTSGTHTITLGGTNRAKLTADELAIAKNKNWEVT